MELRLWYNMMWQILTGTSAQLGYTEPFTLVHARKYRTEDELKTTDNTQTKHNPEQANNVKQKLPGLATFHDTRPGNEVNLFYNTLERERELTCTEQLKGDQVSLQHRGLTP